MTRFSSLTPGQKVSKTRGRQLGVGRSILRGDVPSHHVHLRLMVRRLSPVGTQTRCTCRF